MVCSRHPPGIEKIEIDTQGKAKKQKRKNSGYLEKKGKNRGTDQERGIEGIEIEVEDLTAKIRG